MSSFDCHNKSKKRRVLFLGAVILAVLICCAASLWMSKNALAVTRYRVSSKKLSAPVRIVQLTDLHNSLFGEHNKRLLEKVAAQEPDLILITGDLLDQNDDRTDIAAELITGLSDVAPVYVSYGNHEIAFEETYGQDLRALYTEAGAHVLEFDWQDLQVNGQTLHLGGLYGYCIPRISEMKGEVWEKEWAFLEEFEKTEFYSILLCHMPVSWIAYGSLGKWQIDCVLCGHSHGGQLRFPLIGGLWAPDQGWFPGRESGLYFSSDGKNLMVLSRGLGNTERLPRFNNIPEILVLQLLPG